VLADPAFLVALFAKMAMTAAFVAFAVWTAERAGALIGALVATLPLAAGPAYVFLALDHGDAFIAESALASLAATVANVAFCLVYVRVAQTQGAAASLAATLAAWAMAVAVLRAIPWTLAGAIALNAAVLGTALVLVRRFRRAPMRAAPRRWYDLPLRALMVALLIGVLVTWSAAVGPVVSGALAVFPIILTSLVVVLHPRVGGPAAAAVFANGIAGLIGYALSLVALHLAAIPLGRWWALGLSLLISVLWNLGLLLAHRRGAATHRH